MAQSVYDDQFLTEDQRKRLAAFTEEWDRANSAGDRAGMDAAHAAAERVRAEAGYSGGGNGGSYIPLEQGGGAGTAAQSYQAAQFKAYEPQVDAVNGLYDAEREANLSALKTAYDQNNAALEAQRAEIPEVYQAQRNETAAQSEVAGRNFREYAAASGLSSGAGGQAELARTNQLQGDLSAISRQETAERRGLEAKIAQLKLQYQNEVSAAIAQGEYDRAAALLEEYRRAAESSVTVAQAQADENYRAWQSGQSAQELEYQRERDALEDARWREQFDYGKTQDAQSQANWQAQFDYGKEQDAQSQQNWERQFAYGQDQDTQAQALEDYQNRLKMAQLQAEYGDLSGLRALGVDTSEYERQLTAAKSAAAGGSSGGESTSTQSKPALTWPQVQAEINAGNLTPNVLSAYRYYMGEDYGVKSTASGSSEAPVLGYESMGEKAQMLYRMIESKRGGLTMEQVRQTILDAYNRGDLTDAEADFFDRLYSVS